MNTKLLIALAILVALIGFGIGRWTAGCPLEITKVVPEIFEEEEGDYGDADYTAPDEIVRWRTEYVRVPYCADVPEVVAETAEEEGGVFITSQNPVEIEQPVFGDPIVVLDYYDEETGVLSSNRYTVREHPFKYGIEIGADVPVIGQIEPWRDYQAHLHVYTGWENALIYAGPEINPDGVSVRIGLKARFGR